MAVSRTIHKKSPTQNPVKFFEGQQQGGTHGKPTSIPDVLASGPMREKIHGRKSLGKQ
jgi:hypothetical protein